jgi:type II secretory pathway pseudopilin PulG
MTMVEVTVAVVLLTLFSVPVLHTVMTSTNSSADNRARVTAAGLASRELALVGEELAASAAAANHMVGVEVVNPHPTSGGSAGAADAFVIDGTKYRVTRTAQFRPVNSAAACADPTGTATGKMATLVTVTVTWDGRRQATQPHKVSKIFPPNTGGASGVPSGMALITVHVQGLDDGVSGTKREGVRVRISGTTALTVLTTNAFGCAVTLVTPAASGSDYDVQLLGGPGGVHVTPGGDPEPTQQLLTVMPGSSRSMLFEAYDKAATLTVTVDDWENWDPPVTEVVLTPSSALGGGPKELPFTGADVVFENLYPDVYNLTVGTTPPMAVGTAPSVTVPLGQGASETVTVVK